MPKATFDKSRSLTLYARCNETPVPKILTFVNEDGTDHAIASYDFEFRVYNRTSSSTALFTLTIGSGLTVQNTNELLISPTLANATRDPDTHFWTLFSDTEDATWLNGPFIFHRGEFDGVDEDDTITITENGTAVEITVSSGGSAATQSEVNAGTATGVYVSPSTLANSTQWATKQDTLVSGTNIKTINGSSVLGSGDLTVGGVSGLTATRIPFASNATTLEDDADLSFTKATNTLNLGGSTIQSNAADGTLKWLGPQHTTNAYYDVQIGYRAGLNKNAASHWSVWIGYDAGVNASGGSENVGIGYRALYNCQGEDNVGIGVAPGAALTGTGRNNIFIGYYPGAQSLAYGTNKYSNGSHSIFIGSYAYVPSETESAQINIGNSIFVRNNTNTNPPPDEQTGNVGLMIANPTARLHIKESTTSYASLRIPHGTAPSSPNDGDIWTTTAGLFVRINGVTVGPLS